MLSLSIDGWAGIPTDEQSQTIAATATTTVAAQAVTAVDSVGSGAVNVRALAAWFFFITAMLATQDIAVDAWSVQLISKEVCSALLCIGSFCA